MKLEGDTRTFFGRELFYFRIGSSLTVNDMSSTQERLSDGRTDGASDAVGLD